MRNRISVKELAMIFIISIILISSVSAWGASVSYWEEDGNELKLKPGETRDVTIRLQNMPDADGNGEDIVLSAELVEGEEIATLIDEDLEYDVPLNTKHTTVNIRISIPEDAQLGQDYKVGVRLKQIVTGGDGMVQFTSGMRSTFPVKVVSEGEETPEDIEPKLQPPKEKKFKTEYFVIAIVLIVAIVVIIVHYTTAKRKSKQEVRTIKKKKKKSKK